MTLAYVVRCNFNDPGREAAWNDWYSGPKLKQMLDKPFFLTTQRFRRVSGRGRNYLAFWTLASAEAFETPEYKNDWGFFEWKPYIVDWSRDLFEAEQGDVAAPDIADGGSLRLVSFEGSSDAQAEQKRAEYTRSGTCSHWYKSVGLDRHTTFLGVSRDADAADRVIDGVFEAVYQPISAFTVSSTLEGASASPKARS